MNKKLALAAVTATLVGSGLFATSTVFAQGTTTHTNPMSTLVGKIATKFHLNQSDVQAVFDENRAQRQAEMEAKFEQRLTQAVTNGEITEAQKQLILTKHKEISEKRQTEMQSMQSLSRDERKAAMDKQRTELEQWAKDNNVDVTYLFGGLGDGPRGPGGFRGGTN